jgi:hypothetical protein
MAGPSEFAQDPGPAHKRRLMTHVLPVPAREISDPVAVFVLMKAGDWLLHETLLQAELALGLFRHGDHIIPIHRGLRGSVTHHCIPPSA